jgi:uncharacterized protein YvpB
MKGKSLKKAFLFVVFVIIPIMSVVTALFYSAYRNFREPSAERAAIVPSWLNAGGVDIELLSAAAVDSAFAVYSSGTAVGFDTLTDAFVYAEGAGGSVYVYMGMRRVWDNTETAADSVFIEIPNILQRPALDRGCGIVCLAMLLNHYGADADKMTLAGQIATVPYRTGADSEYWGDPNAGFVGNIYTFDEDGLGVYHAPIYDLLNRYLPGEAVDLTGLPFDVIKYFLSQGRPVWVVTNYQHIPLPESEYSPIHRARFITRQTEGGGEIVVTYAMHSVLVTGYDANFVYFNDPLGYYSNSQIDRFIASWEQMGRQAVGVAR